MGASLLGTDKVSCLFPAIERGELVLSRSRLSQLPQLLASPHLAQEAGTACEHFLPVGLAGVWRLEHPAILVDRLDGGRYFSVRFERTRIMSDFFDLCRAVFTACGRPVA